MLEKFSLSSLKSLAKLVSALTIIFGIVSASHAFAAGVCSTKVEVEKVDEEQKVTHHAAEFGHDSKVSDVRNQQPIPVADTNPYLVERDQKNIQQAGSRNSQQEKRVDPPQMYEIANRLFNGVRKKSPDGSESSEWEEEPNPWEGMKWYELSAECGYADAYLQLSRLYREGKVPVPQLKFKNSRARKNFPELIKKEHMQLAERYYRDGWALKEAEFANLHAPRRRGRRVVFQLDSGANPVFPGSPVQNDCN
jgi:hypothetical protein